MDCNQLAVDIDNEIVVVYNFLRDTYRTKFPELESLVHSPLEYARVVQVCVCRCGLENEASEGGVGMDMSGRGASVRSPGMRTR